MRVVFRSTLFSALGILALSAAATAQTAQTVANKGHAITPADVNNWNSIRQNVLSADGKWFAYVLSNTESDATLIVRGTAKDAVVTRINVGNGGGSVQISDDSKWMGYLVNPPRPPAGRGGAGGGRGAGAGRGGRGGTPGGGGASDSAAAPVQSTFVLRNLLTNEEKSFKGIRRFTFNADKPSWVVMSGGAGGGAAGGGRGAAGGRGGRGAAPSSATEGVENGGGADLLLVDLNNLNDPPANMGHAAQYSFNEDGDWLAYTMENPDETGNGVQLRNMTTGAIKPLEYEASLYRNLAWVDSSRSVAVMKGKIMTSGARDTVFSLEVFRNVGAAGPVQKIAFTPEGRSDFPAGMKLASERAPRYSADMSTVFFGIRAALKPGARAVNSALVQPGAPGTGGTIAQSAAARGSSGNAASDSVPSLILWNAKDSRLQSQQIVQEEADRAFNFLVEYRFPDNRFIRLTDDSIRNVTIATGDRFAYATDNSAYQQQASYSGRNYADMYLVDLKTGARKLVWKKHPGNGGLGSISPDGKKALYWGADGNYWVLNLATLDSVNITKGVPTSFVDTEDDHNNLFPPAISARGWTKDNASVLLYDNWDIWKVSATPGTPAVNLTVDGRKNQIRYRTIYSWADSTADAAAGGGRGGRGGGRGGRGGGAGGGGIDLSKPMFIGTYGEWTKKEGVSKIEPGQTGAKSLFFEDANFAITKASAADVFLYTRSTFTEYPDWWVFNPGFAGGYKITDANPQMKELAMSSGTRLINYKSDKGDKLQGALYLPANYEPGKKYPLLVTIYEKRSQLKNTFVNPSETSTPNARMYTSRGYAVLDPDIVYKVNDPGMSAVWSVVPAVKAAIATGMIDEKHVGLWGHSWGGYQTAFLVTQTNIFAAAVAGAALTDMVSMYNSIYWNTGGANQAIFESSQGRFKGNVADNYEAYIRNSPVFHAQNVTTPLMLLHNDKDGAVDFNQGITYFNALRQLGKDVVLLEYVGENHSVGRPVNQKDYAVRMGEWFDHYLMGKPAPDWMKNGIPRLQMADHLASRKDTTGVGGRIIVP